MSDQVSQIQDKTPRIVGIAQEHKAWIMAGAAVVLVLAVAISNGGAPKPTRTAVPAPETKLITPDQAEAFKKELKRDTDNLAIMQQRADAMKSEADRTLADMPVQAAPQYPAGQQVYQPPATKSEDSSIVVSFRHGSSTAALPTPTGPMAAEQTAIRDLIEQQKGALAANIARTESVVPKPAAAPAVPVATAPVETPKPDVPELHAAVGKLYRVFEGTLIESVLTNRLNGSFTGPVDVLVTSPVYSHDREHVLIPQGARVLGEAAKVGQQGQQRLAVVFHRMIMPDGFSVDLDKFQGLNQIGEAGVKDKTDNHWGQIFGTSVALGLVSGFSAVGTGSALTANGIGQYRQGVTNSVGQSSTQILEQRFNILPTITIREGHRVRIWLRGDIEVPAYENHRVPSDI
jgi:type IV secretory pathway VirB10-like protein